MDQETLNTLCKNQAFQVKGRMFTLSVLQLLDPTMETISSQLEYLRNKTPYLFQHASVVIDIQKLGETAEVDFMQLKTLFTTFDMVPVGVVGATEKQKPSIIGAGLAIFPETKPNQQPPADNPLTSGKPENGKKKKTEEKKQPYMLVTKPVRSGQQIYARNADLIVCAPISPGAEILADGSIHVYGKLAGRALAGVNGDTNARIFCQQLEADLVSIAGHYRTKDNINFTDANGITEICLENEQLTIRTI